MSSTDSIRKGRVRITKMTLDEISLVQRGDDPEAMVLISKAAPDKNTIGTAGSDTVSSNRSSTEDEDQMSDGNDEFEINKDDLPADVVEYIDGLEEIAWKALGLDSDGTDEDGFDLDDEDEDDNERELVGVGKSADDDDDLAEIRKSHPELAARIEKAEQAADEAEEIAKEEQRRRVYRECIDKAASMPGLGQPTEDLADLFMKLEYGVDETIAKSVEDVLRKADAAIREGALFIEKGSSADGDDAIETALAEIRKADPELSEHEAMVKLMETNPSLYTDSLKEN